MIDSLSEKCLRIIRDNLNSHNVFAVLNQAVQFSETQLQEECWDVINLSTRAALESTAFLDANKDILSDLLKRDTLRISEVDLYQAVIKWSDSQCFVKEMETTLENRRLLLGDSVYQLRFLLMSKSQFTDIVVPGKLLTHQEISSILEKFDGLESKGLLWPLVKERSYFIRASCARISVKSHRSELFNDFMSWVSRKVDDNGGDNWRFRMWNTSYLRFTCDTPVMLHGLRMLGDVNEREYEIAVEIAGVDRRIDGTHVSTFDESSNSYGYDVMLPTLSLSGLGSSSE